MGKSNIWLHFHLLKTPIAGSITLCHLLVDPLVCICSGAIYRQSLTTKTQFWQTIAIIENGDYEASVENTG